MKNYLKKSCNITFLGALAGFLAVSPVVAQSANFGSLTLGNGAVTASSNGYTAGFFRLSNIAERDYQGTICTGYGAETPDHILVLQQNVDSLTIQVNSGGNDTTLMIQGPGNGPIRCGQDISRRNPDAHITDSGWTAGTYQIWVGTHSQGQRYNYSLSVSQ